MRVMDFRDVDQSRAEDLLPLQDRGMVLVFGVEPKGDVAAGAFITGAAFADGQPVEFTEDGNGGVAGRAAETVGRPPSAIGPTGGFEKMQGGWRKIERHCLAKVVLGVREAE